MSAVLRSAAYIAHVIKDSYKPRARVIVGQKLETMQSLDPFKS